ncbi:MAG: CapA family protein [Peptococcaceae bacterium]|nr:CapA family protein [Peptococcaceae bacterium]
MKRFLFIKLLAVMTCFVSGGLLAGLVMVDWDIRIFRTEETYAQEVNESEIINLDLPGQTQRRVIFSLVGDVMLASGVGEAVAAYGPGYPWRDVAGVLRESDIVVANLECSISNRGEPEKDKQFTFRADPGVLKGAVNAGVDVFTLANNHVLDFGPAAMLDTIRYIRESKIAFTGAGLNESEAIAPAMLHVNGKKVAVLAFSRIIPRSHWIAAKNNPGLASGHNYKLMMDSVKAAEGYADITIVSLHWGKETAEYPDRKEIDLARRLVDAGADIVMGHHPHVLQGLEIYKGKVIAYSLGNFIFTVSSIQKAREGAILQVIAGSDGTYKARVLPTFVDNGTTRLLWGDDRKRVLDRINALSAPFKTTVNAKGDIQKLP